MSVSTPPLSSSAPRVIAAISAIGNEVPESGSANALQARSALRDWWPLGLGLLALLASTSFRFALGLWQQPEFEHGPLMVAVALWLVWSRRETFVDVRPPKHALGAAIFLGLALLLYLLGVRLKAGYLEFGSLILVVAGVLLLMGGRTLLKQHAFMLLFLAFATPLPAPIVGTLTSGLKEFVSFIAEWVLGTAGYPVARDGVILRIGQYNLLLADACSGMNSLFSLSAVGLLYVYLRGTRPLAQQVLVVAAILPVAVATNIVRVMALMLLTYYFGDEVGQGYLHEFAGFLLFFVAIALIAVWDALVGRVIRNPDRAHGLG
jgi:exosortase B